MVILRQCKNGSEQKQKRSRSTSEHLPSGNHASRFVMHRSQNLPAEENTARLPARRLWSYALLVFLAALAFRTACLLEAAAKPDFDVVYMDTEYNLEWARCISSGAWPAPYDRLQNAPYFRAPLYSLFLAALLKISSGSLWFIRAVQILLGSLSCMLAYLLAYRCYGHRVGLITGFFCAVYWVLAYFDAEFLLPVLLVFLALAGFCLLSLALDRRSLFLAGLAGLMFGLFSITRPNVLAFFPVMVLWALRVTRSWARPRQLLFALLLAAGFAVPPLAATVRNRVVSGDWVVVASQGGVNFYIGNNPHSNGMQAVVPGTRATWWGGYEDTVAIAEKSMGRSLRPSEVSDYWYRRAFEYIRSSPGHWLKLTARKCVALVGDVEIPNNEPYEARRREFITQSAVPLSFGLLFAFFAVSCPWLMKGVSGTSENRRAVITLILMFMAVYSATIVAFFVTGRYRVPLVPFVAMGAAVALVRWLDFLRARCWWKAATMAAVAALLFAVLRLDMLDVRRGTSGFVRLTRAQDNLEAGRTDQAIAELEKLREDSILNVPEVDISLARAYLQRGRPEDHSAVLVVSEESLMRHPGNLELLWYAAVGNVQNRNWTKAEEMVRRYLALEPNDVRALHLGCLVALRQKRRADAEALFTTASGLEPNHPAVQDMKRMLEREARPPETAE